MPDPKKDNPPAIQGGGDKTSKGKYNAKHTNLDVGTSTKKDYTGKHRDNVTELKKKDK